LWRTSSRSGIAACRRRIVLSSLGALACVAAQSAFAQSPRRTTVGRLLKGRVDTIDVGHRVGGELGSQSARLLLVRVDSTGGFVGTLRLQSHRTGRLEVPERGCDTTLHAAMPAKAATRLLTLLRGAVIEPGEAASGIPMRDVWFDDSYRLATRDQAIVVRDGRTVVHGETRYRAPLKRDRQGRIRPPWPAIDTDTPFMKAHELLATHLRPELSMAFAKACSGE
jgi:hypothetical protein